MPETQSPDNTQAKHVSSSVDRRPRRPAKPGGGESRKPPTRTFPATGPSSSVLSLRPAAGTKIAVMSDIHIGIHDEQAIRALIECYEREGVTLVVANGDIHDCGPVSRHVGKARRAALTNGQLAEEAASGRWIIDWMATRDCIYGVGNHEDWINDLALETNTVGTLTVASALGLPVGPHFRVLDHGYQIRMGSLVAEHGDMLGIRGGTNLAGTILRRYPNQTTIVGHYHHDDYAIHSVPDHRGIVASHAAHCAGHLSLPQAHSEYAGRHPNWQQGGLMVTIWYDGPALRYTIQHIEIHRDRRNRPVFEFGGHVYR